MYKTHIDVVLKQYCKVRVDAHEYVSCEYVSSVDDRSEDREDSVLSPEEMMDGMPGTRLRCQGSENHPTDKKYTHHKRE